MGEYRAFVSATGGSAGGRCLAFGDGDSWENPGSSQTDRHPVTCVSLDDAQAYVLWLSRTASPDFSQLFEIRDDGDRY
ncbi:MAG: SUMF1/EgtB/PvdO family nonheme iron enzyme, partial [Acidobacteria bacterium]|nr:SUMF1/EgtB/PvdO family nonheme iron enzyme [Acidobacteriota bacterium]